MIIAVDFDGTIVEHAYPEIGKPNIQLIKKLRNLKQNGTKLILWTCRNNKELSEAVAWCHTVGLTFDAVNDNLPEIKNSYVNLSNKIYADFYLDDRSLTIQDFLRWNLE